MNVTLFLKIKQLSVEARTIESHAPKICLEVMCGPDSICIHMDSPDDVVRLAESIGQAMEDERNRLAKLIERDSNERVHHSPARS